MFKTSVETGTSTTTKHQEKASKELPDLPLPQNVPESELYPMLNLIPQIKQPLWKVTGLIVLQTRAQILRAVTSPLTRDILRNVEETLQFRKYYEEQLCQFYNYGLAFVNDILMERMKIACWYVFALQLKCRRLKKSDSFVPHYILVELVLHRKPQSSYFAKKTIKSVEVRKLSLGTPEEEPVKIIPLHADYMSDDLLKAHVETPITDQQVVEYMTVIFEIAIGEKNKYRETKKVQDDPSNIMLTEQDEVYLGRAKGTLELNSESLGRISIRYIRPTLIS